MLNPVASAAPQPCVPYVLTAPVKSRKAQSRDSNKSNLVQGHLLFPPPPPGHRTAQSVCSLAFCKDAAPNHILCDCLPLHVDVVLDCVDTTLLQHHLQGRVYPLVICPPPRYVPLRHPIRRADVEAFKPGHDGRAQNPRLASIQEDGLRTARLPYNEV
jgi:hypothetical protein